MPTTWEEHEIREIVEEFKAVTIPVNVSVEAHQVVLDTAQVRAILSKASAIALGDCQCRIKVGACDRPIDVCMDLNEWAKEAVEKGKAREISLGEALHVLERSHEAGLVHLAYRREGEDFTIICSCCGCCCHHMVALKTFGYHDAIAKSDFVVEVDQSLCTGCGLCVERCQFGAWTRRGESVTLERGRCFGCGLCVSACPQETLSLVRR